MEGDVYHKTITVPSKANIIGAIVVGIILLYVVVCFAGVVPSAYNIVDIVTGNNPQSGVGNGTGNGTGNSSGNDTIIINNMPHVYVWGMPKNINITASPHTSWQITIKVTEGSVTNLKFALIEHGIKNITVSLNSVYSNWAINGNEATYIGTLNKGMFVTITMNIDVTGNAVVYPDANIELMPEVTGVVFSGSTLTTEITP